MSWRGRGGPRLESLLTDLRERVVAACDAGDSAREQIAARFSVGVVWIRKLMRQRPETAPIAPLPHGGGRDPAFDAEADRRLCGAVRADGDATLRVLADAAGVACRVSAARRALKRLRITRK